MSAPPLGDCTCAIPSKPPREHPVTCPVFRWWASSHGADAFDHVALALWQAAARMAYPALTADGPRVLTLTRCASFGRMIVLPGDPDDVGAALLAAGLPVRFTRITRPGTHHVETIVVVDAQPVRPSNG